MRSNPDKLSARNNKIKDALQGIPKSEEHRLKLSAIAKTKVGKKNSFFNKHHSSETCEKLSKMHQNEICQFDLDGNYIQTFRNAGCLIRSLGLPLCAKSRIRRICNGDGFEAYGYIWRYQRDCPENKLQNFEESFKKVATKHILMFDLNHNLVREFISAKEVETELGYDSHKIRSVCRNNKKYKEYIWEYK